MSRSVAFPLRDLGCSGGSASAIERVIGGLPGVSSVYVNPVTDTAYLEVEDPTFQPAALRSALGGLGIGGTGSAAGSRQPAAPLRLDARAFGLAAGVTAAALFSICATAVAVAPAWSMAMATDLFHLDISGLATRITWGGYVGGVLAWGAGTALAFGSAALLYNRWASEPRRVD